MIVLVGTFKGALFFLGDNGLWLPTDHWELLTAYMEYDREDRKYLN